MEVCTKMSLLIVTFNVILVLTRAASIPSAKESIPSRLKNTLCSENATLDISEVCLNLSGVPIDASNSTLKPFENLCDHAVYLVLKLCEVTQPDSKVRKEVAFNVTELFSIKQERVKSPDENGLFCHSLRNQIKLGFVNNSPSWTDHRCVDNCMMSNEDSVKPICKFMQWSWQFLHDHSEGLPETSNGQLPPEVNDGTNDVPNQPFTKSSGPKTHQGAQDAPSSAQGNTVSPKNPKLDQGKITDGKPANSAKDQSPDAQMGNAGSRETNTQVIVAKTTDSEPSSPQVSKQPTVEQDTLSNPPVAEKTLHTPADGQHQKVENEEDKPNSEVDPEKGEPENDVSENNMPGGGDDQSPQKPPLSDLKNAKEQQKAGAVDLEGDGRFINNDDEDDDGGEVFPPSVEKSTNVQPKQSLIDAVDEYSEAEDSHFFVFFFIATFICILFYLIYQNKRKIIAMALEGKKGRHSGRRRPTSASYQKLDNKLDEVMASSPPPSKTHVIY